MVEQTGISYAALRPPNTKVRLLGCVEELLASKVSAAKLVPNCAEMVVALILPLITALFAFLGICLTLMMLVVTLVPYKSPDHPLHPQEDGLCMCQGIPGKVLQPVQDQ